MLTNQNIQCSSAVFSRRFSIAPMMEYTDKHCRYFFRLLTKKSLLYTEMVTTGALIYGKKYHLLDYNTEEQPVALQLGGSNPDELAQCAKMAQERHYYEVNLNIGCPSHRVQKGDVGVCLMANPSLVAKCVQAMKKEVEIPITVKHRIGIQQKKTTLATDYNSLKHFIETLANAGCDSFIVHARVAILEGLTPKDNRHIPPLKYPIVYALKNDFPELEFIINGGIKTLDEAQEHIQHVDGIMMGREAYQNPFILNEVDQRIFRQGNKAVPLSSRMQIAIDMIPYLEEQLNKGVKLHQITRHMLNLFKGMPNSRKYKQMLTEANIKNFNIENYRSILVQCFG